MRLGINLVPFFPGKMGGAEQYIRNVICKLEAYEDIEIYLFLNENGMTAFEPKERLQTFQIKLEIPHAPQLVSLIEVLAIDVWFCPLFHLIPEECPVPSVVAVFDIQQDYFPEYFDATELAQRQKQTAATMERADKIITISEFSKQTIIEKYNVSPGKISVTWLDADSCFDDTRNAKVSIEQELPHRYAVFPANSWPHKNHLRLLEAYSILKEQGKASFKLVFTGFKSKSRVEVERYILQSSLENDVCYLGYISQSQMPVVFRNACMLVFPSLFEGFGIPLVEAMKSSIPIACSNCTSLPEIAGDAAIFFDPMNPFDIADKMDRLNRDISLRKELIAKGDSRKKLFSWDQCAEDTIATLKSVYVSKEPKEMFLKRKFPLVSIVTPSYNQGKFIKETIDSVLSQDYPNIEYIVMDGGSTDETLSILKSYGNQIQWVSKKDEGQADAVNKGILAARGEIIGWLNSDDTYYPGAVSKAVEYFRTHPQKDMVYGEGHYIDKESKVTTRYLTEVYDYQQMAGNCFICQPAAFFTKDIVMRVGLLNKELQLCMDYELWMRIGKQGSIGYIPDYLATSRMYEENKTLSRRNEVYKEICATVRKHYGYTPFTWIYGYAHHLNDGVHNIKFKLLAITLFLRYNSLSFRYVWKCIKKSCGRVVRRISRRRELYTDKYVDGWLSKRYQLPFNLEAVCDSVEIRGQHILPMKGPLVVALQIDGVMHGEFTLEKKGEFVHTLRLRDTLMGGFHELTLVMSQTYNPFRSKAGEDDRDLSFILDTISWKEERI